MSVSSFHEVKSDLPPIPRSPSLHPAVREPAGNRISALISIERMYGSYGAATINQVSQILSSRHIEPVYDSSRNLFVLLWSSDEQIASLNSLLQTARYSGWTPQVLDERDEDGNCLMRLDVPLQVDEPPSDSFRENLDEKQSVTPFTF